MAIVNKIDWKPLNLGLVNNKIVVFQDIQNEYGEWTGTIILADVTGIEWYENPPELFGEKDE